MTSYSSKYIAKKKSEILLIKKMGKYENNLVFHISN